MLSKIDVVNAAVNHDEVLPVSLLRTRVDRQSEELRTDSHYAQATIIGADVRDGIAGEMSASSTAFVTIVKVHLRVFHARVCGLGSRAFKHELVAIRDVVGGKRSHGRFE